MKHALTIGALLAAWYPISAQMQPPQQGQPGMPPGGMGMGAGPGTGNVRGEQSHNSRDELEQFQAEAERGIHANVKSFATRITPMLQAQTQTAKDLASGKSGSPSADRHK